MKSDIALHELMRLDEFEENAHPKSAGKHNSKETDLKSEESPTSSVATQETAAAEVMTKDDTYQDSAQVHATELVMEEETSSGVATPADEDPSNYDEPPTELIGAPADETVMSNDVTSSELAELSAVENPIDLDEISTESVALPTEPAIDYERSLPELTDLPMTDTTMYDGKTSTEDPLEKRLEAIPANTAEFFKEVASTTSTFFNNNRQLLTNLGVIFIAFMVTKLAFAGVNAIDDLPLVSPLLKLVGLYSIVKFISSYLIRQQDRQKLVEKLNNTKAEVLGDRD